MGNPGYARTIRTINGDVLHVRINPEDNTNVVLSLEDSDLVCTLDPLAAADLGHAVRRAGHYTAINTMQKQNAGKIEIGLVDVLRGGVIES